MENFNRVDLFDTKGIEYIFVIGYLIILIVFWNLAKPKRIIGRTKKAVSRVSAGILKIPQGVYFNKNHTWTHLEESGIAKVGLDDFLRHVTGDVIFTGLKAQSTVIRKGDLLAQMDQDGRQLNVYSPISGIILETNSDLSDNPSIFKDDPYKKGWIYKIKPVNWRNETDACLLAEDATNWATNEMDRLKDFLIRGPGQKTASEPSMMHILQDGGELREKILSELTEEDWMKFQEEFLNYL